MLIYCSSFSRERTWSSFAIH